MVWKYNAQDEKEVNTYRYTCFWKRDLLERTTNRLIIKPCTFLTKQQATPLLTGKQLSDQKRRNMEKNFLDNSDKHVIAK